jgi:hypothetical protein
VELSTDPQYPSDVIALVIFWRLRYKLSLRDLPEMFLIRGTEFGYDRAAKQIDGRDWETKLTPFLIDNLRRQRSTIAGSPVMPMWPADRVRGWKGTERGSPGPSTRAPWKITSGPAAIASSVKCTDPLNGSNRCECRTYATRW